MGRIAKQKPALTAEEQIAQDAKDLKFVRDTLKANDNDKSKKYEVDRIPYTAAIVDTKLDTLIANHVSLGIAARQYFNYAITQGNGPVTKLTRKANLEREAKLWDTCRTAFTAAHGDTEAVHQALEAFKHKKEFNNSCISFEINHEIGR